MKYKNGKYLLVCGFELCRIEFYGRSNKIYCSPECKISKNSQKTSRVTELTQGVDTKIRAAVRILMKLFKPDEEGKMVISMVELACNAFPFDLPTTPYKDDRFREVLNSFGAFCFYRKGEDFIFYKTQ
jgi:hypothetical protein